MENNLALPHKRVNAWTSSQTGRETYERVTHGLTALASWEGHMVATGIAHTCQGTKEREGGGGGRKGVKEWWITMYY